MCTGVLQQLGGCQGVVRFGRNVQRGPTAMEA